MKFANIVLSIVVAATFWACEAKTPQSDGAKKLGAAPKQSVDKVVSEANKAIEQGEARTREAIDGNK